MRWLNLETIIQREVREKREKKEKEKMGLIKDRNGMYLTEAEDIKKRWQEYTE